MVKRIAPIWIVCFLLSAAGQSIGQTLPDAPSALVASLPRQFSNFTGNARQPFEFEETGAPQLDKVEVVDRPLRQKDPDAIFRKYLSSPNQPAGYYSAGSANLLGRVTHAASRTVVSHNASGKGRLNTTYLLRALTSVAKDEASTPYWRRHRADPFGDFGSTVGNDAGMNVLHEFAPSLQQVMKSHAPRFVAQITQRIDKR
jgi:hypothetical protein